MLKKSRSEKSFIIEESHKYCILLDTREIFLHGYIDSSEDPGVEYRMANTFIKNMRLLENISSDFIVIHQHSVGGEWCEGMMVYDSIVSCKSPIIFICHGIAASMGSIIPQAVIEHGNGYRLCTPNCEWLIHDGFTDIYEGQTHKQAQSWAKWEKRNKNKMDEIYLKAFKKGQKFDGFTDKRIISELHKKLNEKEDWWLDANEAVEYGFVDGIYNRDYTIEDIKKEYE